MTTPLRFAEVRITHAQLAKVGRTACRADCCYLDPSGEEAQVYQCASCKRVVAWCFGADAAVRQLTAHLGDCGQ